MTIPDINKIPYLLSPRDGTGRFALNGTFYVPDHSSTFNWGLADTPRGHGGRAVDKAYLNSKGLSFRGTVSSGSAGGSLPWGETPTTDVLYLDALLRMAAFLHDNPQCIIDYRNGWIQYALFADLKSAQVEGAPDQRGVAIDFLLEDPKAYALINKTGALSSNQVTVTLAGHAPTVNYKLRLQSADGGAQKIMVLHQPSNTFFVVTVPANTDDPLVLLGWQQTLYKTTPANTQWARLVPGSVFPEMAVGANTFSIFAGTGGSPLLVVPMATSAANKIRAELSVHEATWMADSLIVPSNLPGGEYDAAQYDIDVYG